LQHKSLPRTPSLYDDAVGSCYVPQGHLLRKINAVVDFSFVHAKVAPEYHPDNGRQAYNPEVLARLIFLQLQYGLSDRGVIERAQTDHAFRLFLGLDWNHQLPHPTTLTHFRERLGEDGFKDLFQGILDQARAHGLLGNRRVLIDSYNVQADIEVPGFRGLVDRIVGKTLVSLEGCDCDLEYLREEYAALQADKSYQLGTAQRSELIGQWLALVALLAEVLTAIPEPQRTERQRDCLDFLHGAVTRSENHGKQNVKKDDLLSEVDPDARRACKKRGKQSVAGYKEQLAVEADSHFVTHVEVQPGNTDDSEALQPVVAGHEANVGCKPEEVVTDSKYHSGVNRAHLVGAGIVDSIAVPSAKGSKQGRFSTTDFALEFDARGRPTVAVCPGGQLAEAPKWKGETHSWMFHFKKAQCEGCALRERCSKQARGRQLSVDEHYQLTEQARVRQASPAGQAAQIARLGIEREFSHQQRHGGKRTRYRGLSKNRAWGWAWGAFLNVRRLTTIAWERATRTGVAKLDSRGRLVFAPGVDWA